MHPLQSFSGSFLYWSDLYQKYVEDDKTTKIHKQYKCKFYNRVVIKFFNTLFFRIFLNLSTYQTPLPASYLPPPPLSLNSTVSQSNSLSLTLHLLTVFASYEGILVGCESCRPIHREKVAISTILAGKMLPRQRALPCHHESDAISNNPLVYWLTTIRNFTLQQWEDLINKT